MFKKIAYTITFLIFFSTLVYIFLGDRNFSEKKSLEKTEEGNYCVLKNGTLKKIGDSEVCITDGSERNLEDFFIEELTKEGENLEIREINPKQ